MFSIKQLEDQFAPLIRLKYGLKLIKAFINTVLVHK
jgi:hypothetical protein